MKRALVVTNLVGFVHFLWNDIQVLQSLGYEVTFAANDDAPANARDIKRLERMGVRFHDLTLSSKNPLAKENMKAFLEIRDLLAEEKYDLVHCHTPIAGLVARLAANKYRKKGMKVIYTSHGFAATRFSPRKQRILYSTVEKAASFFTDTIITINEEDFQTAKKMHCADVRKISGVGVDTAHYHDVTVDVDEYKKMLGLPTDKIMVLSVGELSARKNHQVIVKALGSLPNKSEYIYVICGREVGGSGCAQMLRDLAREQGVELYLLGHRGDIPEVMHCSDIGAIPSVREGLGLAGIQSLCAEVPLVGTDVQGIREYILEDVTGYLCQPYDVAGYAEAIRKLTDVPTRRRLQKNCYEVAQRFDKRISNQQMNDIYMSVLGE